MEGEDKHVQGGENGTEATKDLGLGAGLGSRSAHLFPFQNTAH